MTPHAIYSAGWEREVALSVIARLLDDSMAEADRHAVAEALMTAGEEAAIEADRKLRQIARDITREAGFEEPGP